MKKYNFITDRRQRFGFRKYVGVGLCSVVLGSFFIVSGQNQQVKADTVDDNTQTSTLVSSTNDNNNVNTDKPSQVVEKNAPPVSTKQETAATENSNAQPAQNNTVKTPEENSIKIQEETVQQTQANDDTSKVAKSAKQTEKATPSPAKDDTVTLDVKNIKATDTKGLTESKVQVATRDNGGYDQATWGTLDITKWTGSQNGENYELTGYTGDLAHIIIPNEADFAKAGQIVSPIGISSTLTHSWFTGRDRPVSIAISKTEGKTVKALGNDWSFAFSGNSWPVHDYYHINPSPLAHFDGNNLDVSDVTKFDHIFADNKLSDTSGVSDWKFGNHEIYARGMFRSNQITDLTGLKEWDTSHFTNISYMFTGNNLTDLTPLAKWNVSHVTTMDNTFSFNKNLTTLHGLEKWKTDALTNLDETFSGGNGDSPNAISNLNDISALKNWNVSHVNTMAATFQNNKINDLSPLTGWKVGNVRRFTSLFINNQIEDLSPLSGWDTHSATSMTEMFKNNNIKSVTPLSNWITNKVIYMTYMFENNQLTNLSGLENWNTGNVTSMRGMFESNQLADISSISNWDTSKVQDISNMLSSNPFDTALLANWNLDSVEIAGNFINTNSKLVVVVNPKYVDLMKGKSGIYSTPNPILFNVITSAPNAVTIGENDEFGTPTVYGAINNESARQAIRAVVDGIVNQYKKDNPTKNVIPAKDLDTLTLIQLANAHFNIGYNNYYKFVDDDDNGKQVGENHNFQGTTDETVDLTIKIPENYELAPNQAELPTSYTFIDGENLPIIIHLVHQTQTVKEDKPITRTITTIKPDGSRSEQVQTVTFTRNRVKDLVTNEIKYGEWDAETKTFPSQDVQQIDEYDSYVDGVKSKIVNSQSVTPNDKNIQVTVTYKAHEGNDTPTVVPPEPETPPDKKDDPTDDKPQTPTPPDEKSDEKLKDEVSKETKKKEKIKNTSKIKHVKEPSENGPIKAAKFTSRPATTDHMEKTNVKTNSPTDQKRTALPKTGEANHFAVAAIGLILAGLSLFGFKKRKI